MILDLTGKRVFVAGHRGMVGAAVLRRLTHEPCEIITCPRVQLDLTDLRAVQAWFQDIRPDIVVLAAAKVGGIGANITAPVPFLTENLSIQTNVMAAAHSSGVAKLVFLGSSCIYPRQAPQPIPEEALLTGPLEPTNAPYAIAKIAGITLCQAYRAQYGADFIAVQPCNLYGPGDNYHPQTSHVLPALIAKMHHARQTGAPQITLWGSGKPLREFLHVDDLADALVFALRHYSDSVPLNIGSGSEISIAALAQQIAQLVGYRGKIEWDRAQPDGTPRKVLKCTRLHDLGWNAARPLAQGLAQTYAKWREAA